MNLIRALSCIGCFYGQSHHRSFQTKRTSDFILQWNSISKATVENNHTLVLSHDWQQCARGTPTFSRIICGSYHENWLVQGKMWHQLIETLNKRYNSPGMLKIVTLSVFMTVPAFMTSKKMSLAANDVLLNNVVTEKKTFKTWRSLQWRKYFCWTYIFSSRRG